VNKNKNKTDSKHRRLALKKETVVHLTDDLLKRVVGGGGEEGNTSSNPISRCNTQCLGEA
jgi:hypothetical protein